MSKKGFQNDTLFGATAFGCDWTRRRKISQRTILFGFQSEKKINRYRMDLFFV